MGSDEGNIQVSFDRALYFFEVSNRDWLSGVMVNKATLWMPYCSAWKAMPRTWKRLVSCKCHIDLHLVAYKSKRNCPYFVVEEKTQAFLEEKRKSDQLLNQLLPP